MKKASRIILMAGSILFFLAAMQSDLYAGKRVGVIMSADIPYYEVMHEAFVSEVERITAGEEQVEFVLQRPFPDSISLSNAARKLIAFDMDLIVTYGAPATDAVLYEKSKIPIVFAGIYNPDIAAVARQATGCGFKVPLSSIIRYFKRLKAIGSLGIVVSGLEDASVRQFQEMSELSRESGIAVEKIDIRTLDDLKKLENVQSDVVFITGSSLGHLWLNDVVKLLRKKKIPTADVFPDFSDSGVLMTIYSPPNLQGKVAAGMAAEILRGKEPRKIEPIVIRDTELVFNLAEARFIGVTIPVNVLIEATKVIK